MLTLMLVLATLPFALTLSCPLGCGGQGGGRRLPTARCALFVESAVDNAFLVWLKYEVDLPAAGHSSERGSLVT